MELYCQSFLRLYKKKEVHIGVDIFGNAEILCSHSNNLYVDEDLGSNYENDDICKKCRQRYKNGERTWWPNALAGSGKRKNCIGGYGGRITNEI